MKLSDSETIIMKLIWSKNRSVTATELAQELSSNDWKITTILTFLSRLVEKGFLSVTKIGRSNQYTATISESKYKAMETCQFVKQIHSGSVKSLFAALCDSTELSPDDLQELQQLLEKK